MYSNNCEGNLKSNIVILWFYSPMRVKAHQQTADFTSTTPKTEQCHHT